MSPAPAFWDHVENRFLKFQLLQGGERLERSGRTVLGSFLLDRVAVTLWDEDFALGWAYTWNMLPQGCAERAEAFLILQLCADHASGTACTRMLGIRIGLLATWQNGAELENSC